METGRLFDIDGDGPIDLLPNGTKFAAWWDIEPGEAPKWIRHELPEQLASHGAGFGDINGDGRGDVVGPHGWAEAPQDRRNDRWEFHSEFDLWQDASIPILVQDVDNDGDNESHCTDGLTPTARRAVPTASRMGRNSLSIYDCL